MSHRSSKTRSKKQVRAYKWRVKNAYGPEESARFTISTSATGRGVHIRWKDGDIEPVSTTQPKTSSVMSSRSDSLGCELDSLQLEGVSSEESDCESDSTLVSPGTNS